MKIEKRFLVNNIIIWFIAVVSIITLADIYGDLLWFRSMGYASVFWTVFASKVILGIVFAALFILIAGINICLARRLGPPKDAWEFSYRAEGLGDIRIVPIRPERVNRYLILTCATLAVFMGLWPAILKWDEFLRFLRQTPFMMKDPVFNKDIGFFVFSYPVHIFLQRWSFLTLILTSLTVLFIYIKDRAVSLKKGAYIFTRRAKVHMSVLAGFILLLIAWNNRLGSLALVYSQRGVVFGAGYTDMNAQLIAYWIIISIALACALIFWINSPAKGWKWPITGLAALVVLFILVSSICPWAVQKFIVEPNELSKEMPYILNNIKYTRLGYDLDHIEERDFTASTDLTFADIQKNSLTMRNVKLWDKKPLSQTYSQLQEIRLYYNFAGVDEDRYTIDGEKTQVMLSVRELDQGNLPVKARTFENLYFKYTHGYGLCMSPVNSMTEKGLPNLVIKDIPPVSQTGIEVIRPEVYYGEKTEGFVIVNSKSMEFDYPKGDINVYTLYEGKGGVPIDSILKRIAFSIKFFEPRLLFTGYITPKSRILFYRQIRDRVKALAPFLTYDNDPYAVVSDSGRIFWILDGYATTDKYPYSERYSMNQDDVTPGQALFTGKRRWEKAINYIRNSVKAIIDAYTGETTFYIVDPSDPIILTYNRIFPQLFKPFPEMPEDLRAHIRYPRDLFEIQAKMYRAYHMKDAQVFYNKEDFWDLPMQKKLTGSTRSLMNGYYMSIRLPEQEQEEFLLMAPFTPDKKSNMIAWLCAQCDGPNYGRLLLYKLPKEKLIYGPRQVDARIDQQTKIARELTLWGQQGSDVVRGDLLVIPVEESILYIEPVYLMAADKSNLPELKRVIVAYEERVEMGKTLAIALEKVFGIENAAASYISNESSQDKSTDGEDTIADLARRVTNYYQAAQETIGKGDWIEYGRCQELLRDAIQELSTALELEE